MRLLQFSVATSTVSVDSYSPFLDEFGPTKYDPLSRYNGAEENFTVPIDFVTRTTSFQTDALTVVTPTAVEIGRATARSGWPASVSWKGLTQNRTYAWTATSSNAAGDELGDVEQYGGVFVASVAGTDVTAPVLDVPADSSIAQGAAFDPLDGVTATDDSDGDVTDAVRVTGAVDSSQPGVYTLVYSVADANGNAAQASRSVRVTAVVAPPRTATTVAAGKVTAVFGVGATLRATVSPAEAGGFVQFSNGEDTLCQAPVTNGTAVCSVSVLPPPGEYAIDAEYSGDDTHAESQRSFVLVVTDDSLSGKKTTTLGATVSPTSYGSRSKVTVRVATPAGLTGLTGTVTVSGAGATQTHAVGSGSIAFALPATLKPGRHAMTVTYSGDGQVEPATRVVQLTVSTAKPAAAHLSVSAKPSAKHKGRATVKVSASKGLTAVTGKVTVILTSGKHSKKVTGTLKKGRVVISLPKLSKGTWKVSVKYAGNAYYSARTTNAPRIVVK